MAGDHLDLDLRVLDRIVKALDERKAGHAKTAAWMEERMTKKRSAPQQRARVISGEEATALKAIALKLDWLKKNTKPSDPSDKRTVDDAWRFVGYDLEDVVGALEQRRNDDQRADLDRAPPEKDARTTREKLAAHDPETWKREILNACYRVMGGSNTGEAIEAARLTAEILGLLP